MSDGRVRAWLGNKAKYELENYEFHWVEDALIYVLKEHFVRSTEEN